MAHRSQSSSMGDNPMDPNYLPPHYREEYRLAIDALVEDDDVQGYYEFLQSSDVVDFLAQPEIEHIKSTVKTPNQGPTVPQLPYHDGALGTDGSSDTYWPVHSDLDAPGLDLGWPMQQHSFVGPTEVTTLVNPSEPNMPSIKEQARRLIKSAQQVIAVVMDMFTDVDIFYDLLEAAARHVPVYILLDEQNAHHFFGMVTNCKVNLDMVQMMRVRTVSGVTYFCRTGKSFKGQVKDRFLLADCRAVLSGNYSFMWSYEKLHRCIAHLFLGELVTTFDEEFRILFAQSQPLSAEHALVPHSSSETSSTSSYYSNQFGLKRTQSTRNPHGYLRQPELAMYPFGDSGRNSALPFRRDDIFRHTMDPGAGITIGKFAASQQFRQQQTFLEQGRSMVSRQMEMSASAYKRHSYAEGTQEIYSSSRQYMKQRVMNNLEETEQHHQREQSKSSRYHHGGGSGLGPGSGHENYDRLRGSASHLPIEQYSDPGFPSDLEPPPHGGYANIFSSEDLRHDPGNTQPPVSGRYGEGSTHKRPTVGQPYACQSSPTQLHPPEKQVFPTSADPERSHDPEAKDGLRNWRIHSYLSTCEDGEEGLPLPMGSDAFEDPQQTQQHTGQEDSAPRFGMKEPSSFLKSRPDPLRPRFGKPILPDNNTAPTTTAAERAAEREKERERGRPREVGVDVEMNEAPDSILSRHESFRTRLNPLLQRSSRLRSSLIFSSSKMETHNSGLGLQAATEEDEESNPIRTSSIVAQILEKRRSLSREPFDWRKKTEEKEKEDDKTRGNKDSAIQEEPPKSIQEVPKNPLNVWEPPKPLTTEPQNPEPSYMNMNDPASRLQYFQELAAKRKASKVVTESGLNNPEPASKSDLSHSQPPRFTLKGPDPVPPKTDLSDTTVPKTAITVTPPETEPVKPDVESKPVGLIRKLSFSSTKPPVITAKPFVARHKSPENTPAQKEESDAQKEPSRTLKPFPSPKFFKKDTLKPLKTSSLRRVSCDEKVLTTDATDTEKSEQKKIRSLSSSSMPKAESKEGIQKTIGSNTSLNTLGVGGDGKADGKPLDFLKKQTQRLKGLLGPKDKKTTSIASVGEDKSMSTVQESSEDSGRPLSPPAKDATSTTNHKATSKVGPSRYQTTGSSVLFSSNLRDDTKVILEQISANSQKNRLEREEASGGEKGSEEEKKLERQPSIKKNRFLRPQSNPQEREGLLQRIESMRKEKKVYSRFEMGNNLG
ncbi:protein FAM83H [Osmerus eperlanus]|uniref:protein FAM83H n=1 Tax=Osmerus eperlanus TaxID=29151 RepID=UPI002E0EC0EA